MKKSLFLLISALALVGCDPATKPGDTPRDDKHVQLIIDNKFQNGFHASPGSGYQQDTNWQPKNKWPLAVDIQYGNHTSGPSWMLSQHGDIYSLNDVYNPTTKTEPTDNGDGSYTIEDTSKKLIANPDKGSLYMELNTSKEYVRPRQSKEQWCHILLDTGFSQSVCLADLVSCDFTIDLEMKKFEDHMNGQANASLHATQFLMYIIVKSTGGADAGDWFWFGIPFFDNRYPTGLPESGLIDAGGAGATSKYIYGMNSSSYLPGGLKLNQKASVEIELLEAIGNGLIYAQNHGFMTHSTLNDLSFDYMNIGFEIPGTYDCGIEISNFSMIANYE